MGQEGTSLCPGLESGPRIPNLRGCWEGSREEVWKPLLQQWGGGQFLPLSVSWCLINPNKEGTGGCLGTSQEAGAVAGLLNEGSLSLAGNQLTLGLEEPFPTTRWCYGDHKRSICLQHGCVGRGPTRGASWNAIQVRQGGGAPPGGGLATLLNACFPGDP